MNDGLHQKKTAGIGKRVVVFLFLLMNLQILSPVHPLIQGGWLGICVVLFALLYPLAKIQGEWAFSKYEIYALLTMLVDLFLPAVAAWNEFGQPIIYGVLSQRWVLLVCVWIVGYVLVRRFPDLLPLIDQTLIQLGWFCLGLTALLNVVLDPEAYSKILSPIIRATDDVYTFCVGGNLLVYVALRYAILAIHRGRIWHYLISATFLFTALGVSGRMLLLGFVVTVFVFVFRAGSLPKLVRSATQVTAFTVLALAASMIFFPDSFSSRIEKFQDAFAVVTAGVVTTDYSASQRIYENNLAQPKIMEHPIIGNGLLSHQWNGGASNVLGENFDASDIGLVGVLYSVGVLGMLWTLWQYKMAWDAMRTIKRTDRTIFSESVFAFLLWTAITSISTGIFLWAPDVMFFFLGLAVCLARQVIDTREQLEPSPSGISACVPSLNDGAQSA